ncbi:MAG: hypothetical protein C5B60_07925 [Chloroflexi bacterium]|nr:MAG: hypothetical protein C5B60_07925 [Chloroflexota bacterium]
MIATEEKLKSNPGPGPRDPRAGRPHLGTPPSPSPNATPAPDSPEPQFLDPQAEGIQPLAAGTAAFYASNFSIAPGLAWCEITGPALTLTVGANTMTANLPLSGSGYYIQYLTQPLGCIIVAPTVPTLPAGMTQAQTGMSAQGFPGLPTPISNVSLLPATAGVGSVTIQPTATPPTLTVNVAASAGFTIPAGSRWLIFSLTGV